MNLREMSDQLIAIGKRLMEIGLIEFAPGMGLDEIKAEYHDRVSGVMNDYMASDKPITSFRNEMRRLGNDAYLLAAVAGWVDGGGDGPISDSLTAYVNQQVEAQFAFIDDVFARLKELRKSGTPEEQEAYIDGRAAGYTDSINGIYNYAKIGAGGDRNGKWVYGDTDHCETCDELNGQTHPLSWFADNGYVPQQTGSPTLACGGWRCQCRIVDPETGDQLVP